MSTNNRNPQPAQPDYDPIAAVEAVEHYEASAKALDALDSLDAQPGSGEVVRRFSGAQAAQYSIDYLREVTRFVHAEDFDALKAELTTAQQRIAALERDLENERARGIHTCHAQCPRPLCVAQRRIAALESGLSEAIEIMTQGERLLPKGEARFRMILEGKEPS